MQEGIRRKSKDTHFVISIFYLAKNLFIKVEVSKKNIVVGGKLYIRLQMKNK